MPELYQLVGSALRDVAQARFMSDMYSRQISYSYERDSVLRQFPVPRVEIEEVEIDLQFAIRQVDVDPYHHSSRNAAIGSLFDQYSVSIVRESLAALKRRLTVVAAGSPTPAQQAALDTCEKQAMSDDNRALVSGRILRYFNENGESLISPDGKFDSATARKDLAGLIDQLLTQPEILSLTNQFPSVDWNEALIEGRTAAANNIEALAASVADVRDKYPDYLIDVDITPETLKSGVALSNVKIKTSVKNYRWSKVDVDPTDMRNIRTLNQE